MATYDELERSQEGSRPALLYLFALGVDTYAYTSDQVQHVVASETYLPEAIESAQPPRGGSARTEPFQVTLPTANDFVQQFRSTTPALQATLAVYGLQRDASPASNPLQYKGVLQRVSFEQHGRVASLQFLQAAGLLGRTMPRDSYQGLCNRVLYDARCTLDRDDFKHSGTVTASSGRKITMPGVSGFAAGYFVGGYVETTTDQEPRMVVEQSGDDLTLMHAFPSSPVGKAANAYRGCDHTPATCHALGNRINYGGFDHVPTFNLFEEGLL